MNNTLPDPGAKALKSFLQSLSARAEFTIVIAVAFGYAILISILRGAEVLPEKSASTAGLLSLIIFELAIAAILLPFLWARGWSPQKIGLKPTFLDTAMGLALLAITTVVWFLILYLTWTVSPETVAHMRAMSSRLTGAHVAVPLVVSVSIVNAIFEEVFVAGYVITVLKTSRSVWFAINVSVAIRLSYHLYQGQMAALGVLPLGLIYTIWYVRTGRLWPLIVAHTLQDIAALLV